MTQSSVEWSDDRKLWVGNDADRGAWRLQLVKKFPAFYGTRKFITVLTSARHLSLYWTRLIQSMLPHPTSWSLSWYYPPIYAWVFQVVSFPRVPQPKPFMHLSSPPYVLYAPHPSNSSRFDSPSGTGWGVKLLTTFVGRTVVSKEVFFQLRTRMCFCACQSSGESFLVLFISSQV